MKDESGGEAQIILPLIHAVFKARVEIIGLNRAQRETSGQREIQPAAGLERECVCRSQQPGGGRRSQRAGGVSDAEQALCKRREAMRGVEVDTRTGEERSERQTGGG